MIWAQSAAIALPCHNFHHMKHIEEFIETIAALRGPGGCPWDRKQDHASLAGYLLEETHEVLSAIHEGDPAALKEELGDLLLQIVLHCQIAGEQGQFDFEDVACAINKKMIERHPHVFGKGKSLETAKQVVDQWHAMKAKEQQAKVDATAGGSSSGIDSLSIASLIDGVPRIMPALLQSLKVSQKAAACGFEWENEEQVWKQLESELAELKDAISKYAQLEAAINSSVSAHEHTATHKHAKAQEVTSPDASAQVLKETTAHNKYKALQSERALKEKTLQPETALKHEIALELGDVLFSLVNIARWQDLNPEEALLLALDKFKSRFRLMEELSDHALSELTIEQLEQLWQRAKEVQQSNVARYK
jgi:tetrapyrrole methylase family protein / MazG family protein